MTGWGASGALLLVLLIGGSYSLPVKKGGGDPGSKDGGSDSGGGHQIVYSQPGDFGGVANPLGDSGYRGNYQLASTPQNLGPAASRDPVWLQQPNGPGADGAMSLPGHGPGIHSHVSPGGPTSLYQPGELSHMQNTFEHGNYDTETETQGLPVQGGGGFLPDGPMPVEPDGGIGSLSVSPPFYPGGFNPYPYYDWLFLTGQYPPGTVSHFSSDFEQGRDYFHDAHYNKYFPGDPTGPDGDGQQVKQFPPTSLASKNSSEVELHVLKAGGPGDVLWVGL